MKRSLADQHFLVSHALVPGCVLMLLLCIVGYFELDYRVADTLWHLQGDTWAYRHSWLLKELVHNDGKTLSRFMSLCTLIGFGWSYLDERGKHWRKAFLYMLVIPLVSVAIINILKAISGTTCPAFLARYGGNLPAVESVFPFTINGERGCTPAGHSSAGYTWLALYFIAYTYGRQWRWYALLPGVLLGLVFGISQQIRGEHFLSHDLWTLLICWFTSLGGYIIFFRCHNDQANLRE